MAPSMILHNGKIWADAGKETYRIVEALAIENEHISALGTNAEILALADEHTQLIDCEGNTVLPGLCDAHCHGSMSGNMLHAANLFDFPADYSPEDVVAEVQKRLRAFAEAHPETNVIRGIGFNQFLFTPERRPTRQDLDEVCSDRPIVLESFCQHALWTNTKAIELSGLSAATPQPESGSYECEENGYPSGIFHEMSGRALIMENLPGYDYTVEQYKETILHYQKHDVNRYGVTLIQECKLSENAIQAYKELAEEGKLTMRVRAVYSVDHPESEEEIRNAVLRREKDTVGDLFQINTIKYFLEGFFALNEPFERGYTEAIGAPEDYAGDVFFPDEVVKNSFAQAAEAGFQIHIHAMGDHTVKQSIDAIAYAQNKTGTSLRNVIAHVMLIDEEDKPRLGENNIVVSLQPRWMEYDTSVDDYWNFMGQERAERCYPNRSLMENGAVAAYGTDYPVTPPPSPFHGFQCAMTRIVIPGTPDYEKSVGKALGPNQDPSSETVSLEQAVYCTSYNGAYEMFLENTTGSIRVGSSAELAVLGCDLKAVPVEEIYAVEPRMTIFKGAIVYEAE